jgi:hypothetical protein
VGSSARLDAVAKRKIPRPCRESNPGRPARSLVTILTELLRFVPSHGHIELYCEGNRTVIGYEVKCHTLTLITTAAERAVFK